MSKGDQHSQLPGDGDVSRSQEVTPLPRELAAAGGVYGSPSPGGSRSSQVYGCSELYKHTRRMCACRRASLPADLHPLDVLELTSLTWEDLQLGPRALLGDLVTLS